MTSLHPNGDDMHAPVTDQDTPPPEPQYLHIYACSLCRTIAATSMLIKDPPLECVACRRWMAYQYSDPITTDGQLDIARMGVVYNPFVAPTNPVKCGTCRQPRPRNQLIEMRHVGLFCSEDCAQVGVLKHRAYLDRRAAEQAEEEKRFRPWLIK